jgi:hypothetical protein
MVLLLAGSTWEAQAQGFKSLVKEIQDSFDSDLDVRMHVRAYVDQTVEKPFFEEEVTIKRSGERYYYRYADSEVIISEDKMLVVDHQRKKMHLNARSKEVKDALPTQLMEIDSVLSYYEEVELVNTQNGIATFRLGQQAGTIHAIEVSIHEEKKKITELTYFYTSGHKVSILFDQFENSVKEEMLGIEQFVLNSEKGLHVAKDYSHYRIIN